MAPRLDTRDLFALLKTLADLLGGAAAEVCTWQRSEDLVRAELAARWALRRGAPYAEVYETEWLRQLESGGWWEPPAPDSDRFAQAVLDAGGWFDPFYEPGWVTSRVRARGGLTFPLPSPPRSTDRESAGERPRRLRVAVFTPAVVNLTGSPNQPVLYELLGQPDGLPWEPWVELSPEAAAAWGVRAGERVRLVADHGTLVVRVVVAEGALPELAALAFVPAVSRGGRWARLLGADARRLLSGGEALGWVRLERV